MATDEGVAAREATDRLSAEGDYLPREGYLSDEEIVDRARVKMQAETRIIDGWRTQGSSTYLPNQARSTCLPVAVSAVFCEGSSITDPSTELTYEKRMPGTADLRSDSQAVSY